MTVVRAVGDSQGRAGGLRINLGRPFFCVQSISDAGSLRGVAGKSRQFLRAADGLQILVQDLICGGARGSLFHDVALRFFGRTVQRRQIRCHLGAGAAAMAGVASYRLAPAEGTFVQRIHHGDHAARRLLVRIVVGDVIFPTAIGIVAIDAGFSQRRRKKSHDPQELVDRNSLQDLNVFENVFRYLRLRLARGLCMYASELASRHKPAAVAIRNKQRLRHADSWRRTGQIPCFAS